MNGLRMGTLGLCLMSGTPALADWPGAGLYDSGEVESDLPRASRSWDDGFFRGQRPRPGRYHGWLGSPYEGFGGSVDVIDGRAYYDYDRGYPYDRFDYGWQGEAYEGGPPALRCRTQWVSAARKADRVAVRVCSGGAS